MDVVLARSLARWGSKSVENREQLEDWLDEAVIAIAQGKGSVVQSTAANGMNVSFSSSGMSNAEWLSVLTLAIQYIDTPSVSKITGRVC